MLFRVIGAWPSVPVWHYAVVVGYDCKLGVMCARTPTA